MYRLIAVCAVTTLTMAASASAQQLLAERGAYLVNGVGACSNCHTPRGPGGATDLQRALELGQRPGRHALGGEVGRRHVLLLAEFAAAAAEPGDVVHLVGRRAFGMADHAMAERHEILAALDRVLEVLLRPLGGIRELRDLEWRLVLRLLHRVADRRDAAQIGHHRIPVARGHDGIGR